jgi:hypothetical protein
MLAELDEGMSGFHDPNPNHWGERWQGCWKNWYESVIQGKRREEIAGRLQDLIENCVASMRYAMRHCVLVPPLKVGKH